MRPSCYIFSRDGRIHMVSTPHPNFKTIMSGENVVVLAGPISLVISPSTGRYTIPKSAIVLKRRLQFENGLLSGRKGLAPYQKKKIKIPLNSVEVVVDTKIAYLPAPKVRRRKAFFSKDAK